MNYRLLLSNKNKAKLVGISFLFSLCLGFILSCSNADNNNDESQKQPRHDKVIARLSRYEVNSVYHLRFQRVVSNYVRNSLSQFENIMSEAYYEENNPSVVWIIERWNDKHAAEKSKTDSFSLSLMSISEMALTYPVKHIYLKDLEPLTREQWRKSAEESDSIITIMLFVDAKNGTERKFKEVYHEAMPQFRNEPGVITYQLSQLEEDSTRFVTYEKFRNEEAFQYHLKFPPIQPVIDYLNTNIRNPPFQSGLHRLIPFTDPSVE